MARPIRIERSEPGGGAAPVLPSVDAAAAPARAAARIGEAVVGAIGGIAEQGIRRQREADALTYLREGAAFNARLKAEQANVVQELDDYALSPDFTEEGYRTRREAAWNRAFAAAGEGITHPDILQTLTGLREGTLAVDPTAEIAGQRARRSADTVGRLPEELTAFARDTPIGALPDLARAADGVLTRAVAEQPALRDDALRARARILRILQGRYLSRGETGDYQYQLDLLTGALDPLGEATAGDLAQAPDRARLAQEEILERSILEQPEGVLTEGGGTFPTLTFTPDFAELDAALAATADLPEGPLRDDLTRGLTAARSALERQALLYPKVVEPFWENGGVLPHPDEDGALRAALDDYFVRAVRPVLEDPSVSWQDKTKMLVRAIRGIGFLTPAMGAWVEETVQSANADPGTMMALAQTWNAISPDPIRLQRLRASDRELAQEIAGTRPMILDPLPAAIESRLLALGGRPTVDPASALQSVLDEDARGAGAAGRRRGTAGPDDLERRAFAPETGLTGEEGRLRGIQEEIEKNLLAGFERLGTPLEAGELTPLVRETLTQTLRQERDRAIAKGYSEEDALLIAKSEAFRQTLAKHPPVTLFRGTDAERTVLDGRLRATLQNGRFPESAIDEEIVAALRQRGVEVTDDILERVRIQTPPFAVDLHEGAFHISILPSADLKEDGAEFPEPLIIDGTAYQRRVNAEREAGIRRLAEGADAQGRVSHDEALETWVMEQDEFRRWADPMRDRTLGGEIVDYLGLGLGAIGRKIAGRDQPISPLIERTIRTLDGTDLPAHGGPRFMDSPTLRAAYEGAYRIKREGMLAQREALQASQPLAGIAGQEPIHSDETIERTADLAGKNAVRDLLRREFQNADIGTILDARRNGRLPSERDPDPDLRPTRGPLP